MKNQNEIVNLEDQLLIPIGRIELKEQICEVYSANNVLILQIPFVKNGEEIDFQYSEELLTEFNWGIIYTENQDSILPRIRKLINLKNIRIEANEPYFLEVYNLKGQLLFEISCCYIDKSWNLDFTNDSKIGILNDRISRIETHLKSGQENENQEVDPLSQLVETVLKYGNPLFQKWIESNTVSNNVEIERSREFDKHELEVIQKLDKWDKIFKFLVLFMCIFSLSLLAYVDKAPAIAPVIGVVIGLVLQGNIISEYFSGAIKKKRSDYGDD